MGIGNHAGDVLTTGSNNVIIGVSNADASAADVTHEIVLATAAAVGKGANTAFITANSGAVYAGNNSADFSTTSDRRIKKNIVDNDTGLDEINKLQVRNFEYREADEIEELDGSCAIDVQGVQLGVIAQEIQAVFPDVVKEESTGCLTVDPNNLTWYLVNAVKELSAQVKELKEKLDVD